MRNTLATNTSKSGRKHADEPNTSSAIYNDIKWLLEKGGDSLKFGDVFQMFKKKILLVDVEYQDELKVFKNIIKLGIHGVASCVVVFPCGYSIAWILKHVELDNMYICNARWYPLDCFQSFDLEKLYHIDKGTWKLDE